MSVCSVPNLTGHVRGCDGDENAVGVRMLQGEDGAGIRMWWG